MLSQKILLKEEENVLRARFVQKDPQLPQLVHLVNTVIEQDLLSQLEIEKLVITVAEELCSKTQEELVGKYALMENIVQKGVVLLLIVPLAHIEMQKEELCCQTVFLDLKVSIVLL